MDFYAFYTGQEFEAYRFLGAQVVEKGVVFRVFAPAARSVALIGDFNAWQRAPMAKVNDGNFWEVWVENAVPGQLYKYVIEGADGSVVEHCDPYGFAMELRPGSASRIERLDDYAFGDADWMATRSVGFDKPLNIYELHAGSWRQKPQTKAETNQPEATAAEAASAPATGGPADAPTEDDPAPRWYNYRELAEQLVPYVKEHGYTHIELLPLSEHPADVSWGYQNTGFFAPTSRYGTPNDLRALVDACHQAGIGVIMDFVPVHFACDAYALWNFDGTPLYEYPHHDVGVSEWGSCNFMHSRGEVCSFLQSSAYYWLREFHFDGLRMDAISNLIYWQGNAARGVNGNALQFLQTMNAGLKAREPQAMLIAEDSSSFEGVTKPMSEGGLGFDYKWDMGWMNDTLNYFRTAPEYRSANYHKLTFSMMYYPNERYLLPFSHDEVVHGKATILQKMSGDYEDKFPQGRALYLYMAAHPGKMLNFMGNELGQLREWDEKREQDWLLLDYPKHQEFLRFITALNELYLANPAFWSQDYAGDGFEWIDCHQEQRCIYAFERRSAADTRGTKKRLAFVFNFLDAGQDYELALKGTTKATPLLSTDWYEFGGTHERNEKPLALKDGHASLTLAPYSGICLELE